MSWMAPKLKHRIQIQESGQDPESTGMFSQGYTTLATIWAEMKDKSGSANYIRAIRGESEDDANVYDTEFRVRYSAVKNLGKAFTSGFSTGLDSVNDLYPVKSDYFIFLQVGNDSSVGRRFKVISMARDDDRKEWFMMRAAYMEESGTGAQA